MKKLISIATCSLLIGIGSQASAYYDSQSELTFKEIDLLDVGLIDQLRDVGKAGNSQTELNFINDILSTSYTKGSIDSLKIEFAEKNPEEKYPIFLPPPLCIVLCRQKQETHPAFEDK